MRAIGQYQVKIYLEQTFTKDSVDNSHKYNVEYLGDNEEGYSTMFGVQVFKDNSLLKSAVIGSIYIGANIYETSVIYEETRVLICCGENIFCLSVPNLDLLWRTQADQFLCFEIFRYQDSYIIHGEQQISRLNSDGKIIWQRIGADIFVTMSGEQGFELTDNFIYVIDFENRIYKFDYNGKDFSDKTQF